MAFASQSTKQDGNRDNEEDARRAVDELKSDLASLRKDLKEVRKDLGRLGAAGVAEAKSAVGDTVSKAQEKAREVGEFAHSELEELDSRAQRVVRNNPYASLAGAFLIGYLLSVATRR